MWHNADMMSSKMRAIEELLSEMDSQESEKIKPKAAMVSITAIKKPKAMEKGLPEEQAMESPKEEMQEEDLKKLLAEYLAKKM